MPALDELQTAKMQVQDLTQLNKQLKDKIANEQDDNKRNARYMAMEHAIRLAPTLGATNVDTIVQNATKIHDFLLKGPTQTP